MIKEGIRNAILIIVTSVWAANMIAPLWIKDYHSDPEISAIFMATVGTIYAFSAKNSKSDKDEKEEEPK
jgi:hypothetical protein